MADKSLDQTFRDREIEVIKKAAKQLEDEVKRERKLLEHFVWRGNKLPPFNIEPLPHERQRLGGGGMTAADRALRKQWMEDQRLAPHEPVYVPDLFPKNPIRKLAALPMQGMEYLLKPVIGAKYAMYTRYWSSKVGAVLLLLWAGQYHLRYHSKTWESNSGWHGVYRRPTVVPGEREWDEPEKLKQKDDFHDLKFKSRKVLTDVTETSFTRPAYNPPVSPLILGRKFYPVDRGDEASA